MLMITDGHGELINQLLSNICVCGEIHFPVSTKSGYSYA